MTLDGGVIWRIHLRLRDQVRRPRLFNDRMPAGRARKRLERFRRWCGPCLWQILCDCELKRREPAADVGKFRSRSEGR